MPAKTSTCWKALRCGQFDCPAYGRREGLCWLVPGTKCSRGGAVHAAEKFRTSCAICPVYRSAAKGTPPGSLIRLALYLQEVERLREEGVTTVSSRALGTALRVNPVQVRKDLSEFSIAGECGSGYKTKALAARLRRTLRLDRTISAVVIGCGDCARMVLGHPALAGSRTIVVKRVFAPARGAGAARLGPHRVYAPGGLQTYLRRHTIRVVFLVTEDPAVKKLIPVINCAPVRAILNFSPFEIEVNPWIRLFSFNLQVKLDVIAYYLHHQGIPALPENSLL